MRQHTIEIYCALVTHQSDKVSVGARCGDTIVHVGDIFTAVYRLRRWRVPAVNPQFEDDYEWDSAIEEVHHCTLTVERIERYECDCSEARPGDTARFTLTGSGREWLREGCILGTEEQATAPANWQSYKSGVI